MARTQIMEDVITSGDTFLVELEGLGSSDHWAILWRTTWVQLHDNDAHSHQDLQTVSSVAAAWLLAGRSSPLTAHVWHSTAAEAQPGHAPLLHDNCLPTELNCIDLQNIMIKSVKHVRFTLHNVCLKKWEQNNNASLSKFCHVKVWILVPFSVLYLPTPIE